MCVCVCFFVFFFWGGGGPLGPQVLTKPKLKTAVEGLGLRVLGFRL